jgi:hypothetical protein
MGHYMKITEEFAVLQSALWDAMRRFDFEWVGEEGII